MKRLLLTTAIVMSFGTTAAFAHHPAADIVDPDIYAMIDENVSDIHAAMTFDDMGNDTNDMGGDTTDVGSTRESIASDFANFGADMGEAREDVSGAEMAGEMDIEAAMESREVANAVAESEPSGPMSQR